MNEGTLAARGRLYKDIHWNAIVPGSVQLLVGMLSLCDRTIFAVIILFFLGLFSHSLSVAVSVFEQHYYEHSFDIVRLQTSVD